jgi:hypothetical protein
VHVVYREDRIPIVIDDCQIAGRRELGGHDEAADVDPSSVCGIQKVLAH